MKTFIRSFTSGVITICFFFLLVTLQAQPVTFLKTFNSGNIGYTVREVNSNSYVVAGATDYYYNFQFLLMSSLVSTNIHLLKTTTIGTLLWENIFKKPGYRSIGSWMEPTPDSGFIITGSTNADQVWPPDSNDVILLKTDKDGKFQWAKTYDTGKDDLGFCVQPTSDGGYIVSGFHDAVPISLTGTTYAMLIKTDANGLVQWEKKYELAVRDLDTGEPLPWFVKQTSDHGYVMVGTTANSHAADLYVIRVDALGNVIWTKSYDHDNSMLRFSVGLDIIECSNGDFVIAGSLDKDQSVNQYNYPFILKINSNGDLLIAKFYDSVPAELFQSGFSSVQQTTDNGFLFTGIGGYGGFGILSQILKTDVNFNQEWSRTYTMDGATTVGTRSGRTTNDGCLIFTGRKLLSGTVLMKTNILGLIPCKTPGTLVEILPSVLAFNHFPLTISGINATTTIFNTQSVLTDSSTLCPVTATTLPVELLFFSAITLPNHQVSVEWTTASETNNDYFLVTRSIDGRHFNKAGIIKGAGNSTQLLNYNFQDEFPDHVDVMYYRLEQIDFDGSQHLSKTVAVRAPSSEFKVISGAVDYKDGVIKINIKSGSPSRAFYSVTDVLGRERYNSYITVDAGEQMVGLAMPSLSSGIYFLTISTTLQSFSYKIFY